MGSLMTVAMRIWCHSVEDKVHMTVTLLSCDLDE